MVLRFIGEVEGAVPKQEYKNGYVICEGYVTCVSPLCVNYGVTRKVGKLHSFRTCKEASAKEFARKTGVNAQEGRKKQHRGKTASQVYKENHTQKQKGRS